MNAESRRLRPVEINLEKTILTWQECFYDTVALAVRLRLQALQFFIYFLPFKIVFCVNNKINVMYFSALPSDAACDFYLVAVSAYESFYLVCCFFGCNMDSGYFSSLFEIKCISLTKSLRSICA